MGVAHAPWMGAGIMMELPPSLGCCRLPTATAMQLVWSILPGKLYRVVIV